jgi:hypothetical protein
VTDIGSHRQRGLSWQYVSDKLRKWQQDGKRVYWAHGKQGQGFYPTGGEYGDVFKLAPLQLNNFLAAATSSPRARRG